MKKLSLITTLLVLSLFAVSVFAGTGGTEFQSIYNMILGWAQGYLGKTIALVMFLTGIGMGIARQSIFSVVIGISSALVVYYSPTIIDTIVMATI